MNLSAQGCSCGAFSVPGRRDRGSVPSRLPGAYWAGMPASPLSGGAGHTLRAQRLPSGATAPVRIPPPPGRTPWPGAGPPGRSRQSRTELQGQTHAGMERPAAKEMRWRLMFTAFFPLRTGAQPPLRQRRPEAGAFRDQDGNTVGSPGSRMWRGIAATTEATRGGRGSCAW